jgi:hypothetical protein
MRRLRSLAGFTDAHLVAGDDDTRRRAREALLREHRVEAAHKQHPRWVELQTADLRRRGPWLVHVASDRLLSRFRGEIFAPGSATILYRGDDELCFVVDREGELVFFERPPHGPRTLTELEERRARKQRS